MGRGRNKITTRYHAYISYSHVDARFATWLQHALETWKVPRAIADELGFNRIKPVFRDRSDLRAASNLGDALREALEQSDALIVICSRSAAQSKWVGEEIKYFRQKHGDNRIFSIIASDAPPECFPAALLHDISGNALEPIAADSRRGFDGRKNSLLKTMAGLLQVDFDRLRHRDLRRQYQRMTVVATSGFAVAMITLTLAFFANNARNDANDARNDANLRREQADDLIAFMIGDLRAELEPIGRLDILDSVGDKAMGYFGSLEEDELTSDALFSRVQSLRQIGEIRMSQGDLDSALAAFQLSNEQASLLLDNYTNTELVEFELSQSHFWMGYVHYERDEIIPARQQLESYLHFSQSLLNRDPENKVYQSELAYALGNLGALELKVNRVAEAERYYRETASINEAMLEASPNEQSLRQNLADTLSWLGEIASRSGDLESSISWFGEEYELRTSIVNSVNDMHQLKQLADAASHLAYSELMAGKLSLATDHIEEAQEIGKQLIQLDQENYSWQILGAIAGVDLSRIAAAKGNLSLALQYIEGAIVEIDRLADNTSFQAEKRDEIILKVLAQRARVLRHAGDAHAHEAVKEALSIAAKVELNNDSELVVIVAGLQLLDGDLYAESGNQDLARASWLQGLSSLDGLPANLREAVILMTRAELLDRTDNAIQADELRIEIALLGFRASDDRALKHALIGVY